MPTVLTSKMLTKSQQSLLLNAGIGFVAYNAINIQMNNSVILPGRIENAIITSKNALKSVAEKTQIQHAFCVGNKTRTLIEAEGIPVIEAANNAVELADKIVKKHSDKSFVFLCGNKRQDDLPSILEENNVNYKEIEVYETSLNKKKFHQQFDGILFFSPSAVKSFCKLNDLSSTTAFCIGKTTAAEAEKHTKNIIIAHQPTIENVIVQVVKRFNS